MSRKSDDLSTGEPDKTPTDKLDEFILSQVKQHTHLRRIDLLGCALPVELTGPSPGAEMDAISQSITRLVDGGKIVNKSYGSYAGVALPGV